MSEHEPAAGKLASLLESEPRLKELLEKSIGAAAKENPDPRTNPVRSLEDYFRFIDRCSVSMPWDLMDGSEDDGVYDRIDQGLNYFYFLNDRPLAELDGRGLYNASVQYVGAYRSWLVEFARGWGEYLSRPETWGEAYLALARSDERFGLGKGWYESPDNWHSFNDFFARRLSSPTVRPVAAEGDDSVVCSPADSTPCGVWGIDDNGKIICNGEKNVKSQNFASVCDLLGPDSRYRESFAGGSLTHSFLDVHDYHRYHFPVSGRVLETGLITQECASGGLTRWDAERRKYVLDSDLPDWQMNETRGRVVVETEKGLAALLPVGMSQVSSVNFGPDVKPGAWFRKGDELGWFLFGGSDFVMVFQKSMGFELTARAGEHILMGQEYGKLE